MPKLCKLECEFEVQNDEILYFSYWHGNIQVSLGDKLSYNAPSPVAEIENVPIHEFYSKCLLFAERWETSYFTERR